MEKISVSIGADISDLRKNLGAARDDIKGFNERIKSETAVQLSVNLARLRTDLKEIQMRLKGDLPRSVEIQLKADAEILKKQITQANRELTNFLRTGQKDVSVLGKLFADVKQSVFNLGNAIKVGIGAGAIFAGKSAIELAGNLEQAQIAFSTILGSTEKANALLKDLSDFARNTPFELVGIRENAKQLLAMGVAQENLLPTLKALGDVSAGLSVPLDRLALAYGQVLAKGRLQGGELKQFTEAGVPLIAELAKNIGVSEGEIIKLTEAGKISAVEVSKAFNTMTQEGGKFADLMEKQSKTVQGRFSNLKDSVAQLGEKFGAVLLPSIGETIDGLNELVSTYGDSLVKIFSDTIALFGGILNDFKTNIGIVYDDLTANTKQTEEEQITFGKVVLHVLNYLVSGANAVYLAFKTLGWFLGTFAFAVTNNLWAVAETFVDSFSRGIRNISSLFSVLGNNIGVVFRQGISNAIGSINDLITLINKIPGVKIGQIGNISVGSLQSLPTFEKIYDPTKIKQAQEQSKQAFSDLRDSVVSDFIDMESKIDLRLDSIRNSVKKTAETNKKVGGIDLWLVGSTTEEWKAENARKKLLDAQKKRLEEQALNEIKAIRASTMAEEEKAKKIIEINDNLKKKLAELDKKYVDLEVQNAENLLKKRNESIKEAEKAKTESYKKITEQEKKSIEQVESLAKSYSKVKEEVSKINEEIAKLQERLLETKDKGAKDLRERFVEIKKELEETIIEKWNTSASDTTAQADLDKRIKALQLELELASATISPEEQKKAIEEAGKSKTQIILDELKLNEEKIKKEIVDAETRKAIKEKEAEEFATRLYTETQLILKEDAERRKIEKEYTQFFGKQIQERKDVLQQLIDKSREARIAMESAGISTTLAGQIANGQTNTSTTFNITNNSNVDAESSFRFVTNKIPTK